VHLAGCILAITDWRKQSNLATAHIYLCVETSHIPVLILDNFPSTPVYEVLEWMRTQAHAGFLSYHPSPFSSLKNSTKGKADIEIKQNKPIGVGQD
jgi:hypothetical protein